jgi:hypothetical protein
MPGMGAVLVFFAAAVIAVLAFGAAKARNEALNRAWSLVAQELGLTFTPAARSVSPRLEGELGGYRSSVDIQKRGSGKHRTFWTRFGLVVPSLPSSLELKRKGFLSGLSMVFGARAIELGDDAFDQQVLVKGNDAAALRAFLTPARREHVRRFFATYSGALINSQVISWSSRGRMSDSSRILTTLREMLRLARSLSEQGKDGRTADAATNEAPAQTAGPPGNESQNSPDGIRLAAAAESPGESASDGESTGSLGVAAFSDAVFAAGKPSFEAARIFADHYQGKRIAWSGILRSAEPYRFDFVFGSGPGVKATLTIHTDQAKAFGDGQLKAVIRLPAETEGLDARMGERVSFSGTLFRVDGFMKRVFLTDAVLHGNGVESASID